MTHRTRLSALLLPATLFVGVQGASAQAVVNQLHGNPVRHAWRTGTHTTPRVEHLPEVSMSPAESEVRALLTTYETLLNAGDAARIEALYTEDGVFMPAGFPTAAGRTAVRGAYDAVFSNIKIAIHFTVDELVVHDDFAYARTHSAGTSTLVATGASGSETNRELFIFVHGKAGWKIARYLFNKPS